MIDQAEGQAVEWRPSMRQRIWRAAGFRYHLGEDPPDADRMAGWMRTDIRLHFGWTDRLRLLLTGKLFVALIAHTDTPAPEVCKNRIDWRIAAPGEREDQA